METLLPGCYFIFVVAAIIFIVVAFIKRSVVEKKNPRPWNQDPDDYDAENDLF